MGAMRWSTRDSPRPVMRMRRWTRRAPETRRARRGRTCSLNMGMSSRGGPGKRASMRPESSIQMPGAVPREFASGSAPSGTMACCKLFSVISRPKLRKRARMCSTRSSRRRSLRPRTSETASRVRSSCVGPRPPVEMTSGTRSRASRKASRRNSRLSPTTVLRTTSMPILLSSSVRKRESVSTRSGVSSSEPTAMISAFIFIQGEILTEEGQAVDVPVEGEDGALRHGPAVVSAGRQDGAAGRLEGEANEAGSAEDDFGVALRRDAYDAAATAVGSGNVQIGVAVESHALRAAKATVEDENFTASGDAKHAVIAGGCRAGDVEVAGWMEREVVSRYGRFESGEDENLPARADFEDGAAAIADVEIFLGIEGDAGGDAHALDPLFGTTFGSDAMNRAVVAAGDEEIAAA